MPRVTTVTRPVAVGFGEAVNGRLPLPEAVAVAGQYRS